MIETSRGRVGVECKHPKQAFSELSRTISQMMAYSVLADRHDNPLDRLILVTSEYNSIVGEIIQKYEIPIDIVVLGRHQRMECFYENKA